jgi:WXG100 protein secretion system (Wss), protein YukD
MDLTIVEASGATSEQVRVPASVAIRRIIGRLVVLWRLPDAGPDGRALSYHFEDPRTSRQIDPDTTLALAGVRDKDVLHLVASTVKPSSPTLVQAPSTAAPPVPAAIAAGAATPALADWATGHTPTPAPSPQRRVSAQLMTVLGVAGAPRHRCRGRKRRAVRQHEEVGTPPNGRRKHLGTRRAAEFPERKRTVE